MAFEAGDFLKFSKGFVLFEDHFFIKVFLIKRPRIELVSTLLLMKARKKFGRVIKRETF